MSMNMNEFWGFLVVRFFLWSWVFHGFNTVCFSTYCMCFLEMPSFPDLPRYCDVCFASRIQPSEIHETIAFDCLSLERLSSWEVFQLLAGIYVFESFFRLKMVPDSQHLAGISFYMLKSLSWRSCQVLETLNSLLVDAFKNLNLLSWRCCQMLKHAFFLRSISSHVWFSWSEQDKFWIPIVFSNQEGFTFGTS